MMKWCLTVISVLGGESAVVQPQQNASTTHWLMEARQTGPPECLLSESQGRELINTQAPRFNLSSCQVLSWLLLTATIGFPWPHRYQRTTARKQSFLNTLQSCTVWHIKALCLKRRWFREFFHADLRRKSLRTHCWPCMNKSRSWVSITWRMGKDRLGVSLLDWLYSTTWNWNTPPSSIQPSFYGDCGLRSMTNCICALALISDYICMWGKVKVTWETHGMRCRWCSGAPSGACM